MNGEPLTRGEKVLAVASLVVVATILGSILAIGNITREPDVAFPPPAALPSPNGYDLYGRAALTITEWNPPVDALMDRQTVTDPKVLALRYGLKRREAWLAANAPGFALLRQALALPCRHPSERAAGAVNLAAQQRIRQLARWKATEANTLKMRGDWNGAMQSGLDGIQLGADWPRGGAYMTKLVGSACVAISAAGVQEVPEKLTAAQARAAARRLEALIQRRATHADAIEQEKWLQIQSFLTFTRSMGWKAVAVGSKTKMVRAIERSSDDTIAALKQPYSTPVAAVNRDGLGLLSSMFVLDYGVARMRYSQASEATRLNFLLLRLALRAYALEHGAPPAKLDALAPVYLKTVPRDIFADNAPLHYVREGRSYRLWSVGTDRKDDGGKPVPWQPKAGKRRAGALPPVNQESKGDWVAGKNR